VVSRRRPVLEHLQNCPGQAEAGVADGGRREAGAEVNEGGWRVKGLVRLPDGSMREVNKRGFATKTAGLEWLADQQSAGRKGEYIEPSKRQLGDYGDDVIEGLRIGAQTKASYKKNWRLHVSAYPVGRQPLAQVTGLGLTTHYRALEQRGRKDHREGEGLSARTTRYVHTIIHKVLGQAVKDGLLPRNPADAATPPTAKEAKAPEMHPWTDAQLKTFLRWAREHSSNYPLWHFLAYTGARRGEALALRWRDVDLDKATVRIRRSAGMVRVAGEGADVVEGDTKSGKPRVVDLDDELDDNEDDGIPPTTDVLKAHRKARGSMALQLARADALVFGDIEGEHRNPEHVSRQFTGDIERCQNALGAEAVPAIRLHDLRHTHATTLLLAGVPVHVVSQRLGHASAVVTMTVYAHVLPGNGRQAVRTFARVIREARTA
jgi:integrase